MSSNYQTIHDLVLMMPLALTAIAVLGLRRFPNFSLALLLASVSVHAAPVLILWAQSAGWVVNVPGLSATERRELIGELIYGTFRFPIFEVFSFLVSLGAVLTSRSSIQRIASLAIILLWCMQIGVYLVHWLSAGGVFPRDFFS